MKLLDVDDLRTEFATRARRVHAVDGVSLGVGVSTTPPVAGESGCGKLAAAPSITSGRNLVVAVTRDTGSRRRLRGLRLWSTR